jgi:hypothetical protein
MIDLRIESGDVLDCAADAILLPIDGALAPQASTDAIRRSLGRIARSFDQRHPECELVDELDAQVVFPLPLGQAAAVELSGPFRYAIVLSLLAHHSADTGGESLRLASTGALASALQLCDQLGLASAATPLLKGGWRLSAQQAMASMLGVLGGIELRHPLRVSICVLDEDIVLFRQLAASLGFR